MYYNNRRLALSIFWMILGAVLWILSMMEMIDSTMFAGFGGGLIAVGALQIWRNLKYRRNEEYKENIDIAYTDERNKYIRMKAFAYTAYALIYAEAIASVILYVMKKTQMAQVCSFTLCFIVISYTVSYWIINKRN